MIKLTRVDAHQTTIYVNPCAIAAIEVIRSGSRPNAKTLVTLSAAPQEYVAETVDELLDAMAAANKKR